MVTRRCLTCVCGAQLAHGGGEQDEQLHQGLLRLARKNPNYRRNLPHICSFYARGECNRGDECPYRYVQPAELRCIPHLTAWVVVCRHEIPRSKNDPLSKQNIVDRFHGRNDPVAERMLKRTAGKAQYADPPNEQVRTLWLAPVDAATTQTDIRCEALGGTVIRERSCSPLVPMRYQGQILRVWRDPVNQNHPGQVLRLRGVRQPEPGYRGVQGPVCVLGDQGDTSACVLGSCAQAWAPASR